MVARLIIFLILIKFYFFKLQGQNIIAISPLNNVNGQILSQTNYLKVFEIIPNSNGFNSKPRQLGNSINSIYSAGQNEGITQVNNSSGEIVFYAFTNNTDGFNIGSKDEILIISTDSETKKDEIFFKIKTQGNGATSSKNLESVEDFYNPGNYYLFYKNEALNNNSTLSFIYFDLKNKNILQKKDICTGNVNEGLSLTSLLCDGTRWLLFTESVDNTIHINGVKLGKEGVSSKINFGKTSYDLNTTGGQGDLELSPDNKLLAFANFSSTEIEKDVYIFDIDLHKAAVQNERSINNPFGLAFGLEFSPNSKRLYIGQAGSSAQGTSLFNIEIPVGNYILTAEDKLNFTCLPGQMEILSNGYLYVAKTRNNNSFSYIENPNFPPSENKYKSTSSDFYGENNFVNYDIPDLIDGRNSLILTIDSFKTLKPAFCKGDEYSAQFSNTDITTYQWTFQNKIISVTNSLNFIPSVADTLYLKITSKDGCEKVLKKYIDILTQDASFDYELDDCTNTLTTFPLNPNGVFVLLDSNTNKIAAFKNTIIIPQIGEYIVKYILNENLSCEIDAELKISITSFPVIPELTIDYFPKNICTGDRVTFFTYPNKNLPISWSVNGGPYFKDSIITVIADETIVLKTSIFIDQNCNESDSFIFNFTEPIDPEFAFEYDICTGNLILDAVSAENDIILSDSSGFEKELEFLKIKKTGIYNLTNTTNKGKTCELSSVKQLKIDQIDDINYTLLANAIKYNSTSNGQFCFIQKDKIHKENYEMHIFDRWGNLIFKSNNPDDCWDGSFNGRSLESDVYTYIMYFKPISCDSSIIKISGDITLFK